MRTSNSLVLACVWLIPAAWSSAAGVGAPERMASVPAFEAHLSGVPAEGGELDATALLGSIERSAMSQGAGSDEALAGVRLIEAVTSPEKASALGQYLGPERQGTIDALERVRAAVQGDPRAQLQWTLARQRLEEKMAESGEQAASWAAPHEDDELAEPDAVHVPARLAAPQRASKPARRAAPSSSIARLAAGAPAFAPEERSALEQVLDSRDQEGKPNATKEIDYTTVLTDAEKRKDIALVEEMMDYDHTKEDQARQIHGHASKWGDDVQAEAATLTLSFRRPLDVSSKRVTNADEIGQAFKDLRDAKEKLDPENPKAEGRASRYWNQYIRRLTPEQRYLARLERSEKIIATIEAVAERLKDGRKKLDKDGDMLRGTWQSLNDMEENLIRAIGRGQFIKRELERRVASGELSESKAKYVQKYLVHEFKHRLLDLKYQLKINEMSIKTVDGALAINGGLRPIVNRGAKMIPSMLLHLAIRLRTNRPGGTEDLLRQLQDLKVAFADCNELLGEVDEFKDEAIPKLAEELGQLDEVARKGQRAVDGLAAEIGPDQTPVKRLPSSNLKL